MTTRTRYFVFASLLTLAVGVGTGLVAYYQGFPAGGFSRGGPDELQFVPPDATLVAYANVQNVMLSEVRQRLRQAWPARADGQHEFQTATGINIETDIDRVVACITPAAAGASGPGGFGLVLARGRFDEVKIEALMREHGATVEEHGGRRIIIAPPHAGLGDAGATQPAAEGQLSIAFVEPGLAAFGSTHLVRAAIDRRSGGENITANDEMMARLRSLDGDAWAVGHFDALRSHARLPDKVASSIPPITWFSANGYINGGLRAVLLAETGDEESANGLRDVARGFMALAKMQAGAHPEFESLIQSLELGGTGRTVALSFSLPVELFDVIAERHQAQPQPAR